VDIEILSLFPNYFLGPFDESILKRAREKGLLNIRHTQIRDFALDKHRKVDDRPYGGGPGMVLKPEPAISAIQSVKRPQSHVIYLSPQGKLLTAEKCRSLAQQTHLILLCGHYEGVDERVIEQEIDEEISIGDYVLTNGALAAIVLIDAMARFIPGVLGHPEAADEDSFESGLLDCPHYTRPEVFEGRKVPEVLQNGDHQEIAKWRKEMALKKTCQMRPDLYQRYLTELIKQP
jgi:tRNA (guanine37-N1)-methyltransferase